jgi:hypothetical protein
MLHIMAQKVYKEKQERSRKPRSLGHDGASGLVLEVADSNSTHDLGISALPVSLSRLNSTDLVSRVRHELINLWFQNHIGSTNWTRS